MDLAGATMKEVVNSIRRVTAIMAEITSAGEEQSQGIRQVNEAVIEMDSVTQQNAALVEQAAAAASSLQDQAVELSNIVSVFKLKEMEYSPVLDSGSPIRLLIANDVVGRLGSRKLRIRP